MTAAGEPRIAAAPISWGVCEVDGWGWQAPAGDVLAAMHSIGVQATELGPEGWLGTTTPEACAALAAAQLDLVGGFVTALLHVPARRAEQLAHIDRQAHRLKQCGADTLVLALATGSGDYEQHVHPDEEAWKSALEVIDEIVEVVARDHELTVAIHPHVGTLVEHGPDVHRVLAGTRAGLCLDTGHLTLGGVDPLAIARVWADRIVHVHLKDVDHGQAELVASGAATYADAVAEGLYVQLGEGDAEIAEVVHALQASGYRGWYVLEHDVRLGSQHDLQPIAQRVAEDMSFVRQLCKPQGQTR
ncbi:MAG: TIM barrel protein [Thermoleophilia bacterium]|nr:TIM barrel protein [Thermoleophilia bacterium]